MELKNKYYILRHGQTIYQTKKKKTVYPRNDNPKVHLTEKGRKQVRTSAKKLKKAGIELIYSSDFYRTYQTAKIVARELGIRKIIFDKRLRDTSLGVYQGGKKEDFYRDFPSGISRFSKRPKNGENWNDIQKRILAFMKELEKKYKGKTILIVSHGDPLWLLERKVKKVPSFDFVRALKLNYIQPGELRKL